MILQGVFHVKLLNTFNYLVNCVILSFAGLSTQSGKVLSYETSSHANNLNQANVMGNPTPDPISNQFRLISSCCSFFSPST